MNADAFDAAILGAMRDFYAERTALIEEAVNAARAAHAVTHGARTAERASVAAEPTTLAEVVTHIDAVVSDGTPEQTKTLVGALVAEGRVTGPGEMVPVFQAPQRRSTDPTDEEGPAPTVGTGPS